MRLKDYFLLEQISEREFAALIRVSQSHISNISMGRKNPSLPLAKRIEEMTGGKVTTDDLLNPEAPSRLNMKSRAKQSEKL